MSDPSFKPEEAAPPRPPRPTPAQRQLEADEMYARQLAEHYQNSQRATRPPHYDDDNGPPLPSRNNAGRSARAQDDEEKEYSFFDGAPLSSLTTCALLC